MKSFKQLMNWYMGLPMTNVVIAIVVTWTTLTCVFLSPLMFWYTLAWVCILGSFLGAIKYTECRHENKVNLDYIIGIKGDDA